MANLKVNGTINNKKELESFRKDIIVFATEDFEFPIKFILTTSGKQKE